MLPLSDFGQRICILGPSNSGKSTLAATLAERLDLPAVHLDLLFHKPHTDWEPRPVVEFLVDHDEAIAGGSWVMDGNYAVGMPQRLERATGVIWLDFAPLPCLMRYFRRTLRNQGRAGHIRGGRDSIKWAMIRHIAFVQPRNRAKYEAMLAATDRPVTRLPSMTALVPRDDVSAYAASVSRSAASSAVGPESCPLAEGSRSTNSITATAASSP